MAKHTVVTIAGKKRYRQRVTIPGRGPKDIYGLTVSELEAKVAAYRAATPSLSGSKAITVREYCDQQLRLLQKTVAPATYANYESKLRIYLINPLGDYYLRDVDSDDIEEIMGEIAEQSSSSYRLMHMLVRRIFKAALRAHKIAEDPTTDLSSKGGKAPKELSALSDEQQKALLLAVSGLPVELFVLLGLFAGLRREETLALQWDCVFLDCDSPFIRIRRTWHISHNAPVITDDTKTEAGKREIPIPPILVFALAAAKKSSTSKFVIANADGGPLTGTQWRNLWKQVTVRTTAERTYKRYKDGSHTTHTVAPRLGASAKNNPGVVYSMDFQVTSHKLRRTYITNLIANGVDPKTVQYLAGHENIKITLDIYAKVKYNQPEKLAPVINKAFATGGTEE